MEKVSVIGHGDHGQRVGSAVGANRRPFQRIQGDVHLRPAGTDLLTDIEHRRLIALPFANDDSAIDGKGIEGTAHRIHRRLVRRLFIASPGELGTAQSRRLGNTNSFQS